MDRWLARGANMRRASKPMSSEQLEAVKLAITVIFGMEVLEKLRRASGLQKYAIDITRL
jgi:hypothetical protein